MLKLALERLALVGRDGVDYQAHGQGYPRALHVGGDSTPPPPPLPRFESDITQATMLSFVKLSADALATSQATAASFVRATRPVLTQATVVSFVRETVVANPTYGVAPTYRVRDNSGVWQLEDGTSNTHYEMENYFERGGTWGTYYSTAVSDSGRMTWTNSIGYFEFVIVAIPAGGEVGIGFGDSDGTVQTIAQRTFAKGGGWWFDGERTINPTGVLHGTLEPSGVTFGVGDRIGVNIDLSTLTLTLYINGVVADSMVVGDNSDLYNPHLVLRGTGTAAHNKDVLLPAGLTLWDGTVA